MALVWMLWALAGPLDMPGAADVLGRAKTLVEQGRTEQAEALVRELLAWEQTTLLPGAAPEVRLEASLKALVGPERMVALATLKALVAEHPGTPIAGRSQRALDGAAVVGRTVSLPTTVLSGETGREAGITLVVALESWCTHCIAELPALSVRAEEWRQRGVQVVALTQLTRDGTAAGVIAMTSANAWPGAVLHDVDGTSFETLGISGVPAAAVLVDGVVRWRGHPSDLHDVWLDYLD